MLVANDGETALARVREFGPSIVILDIGMPGMTGFDVARKLRLLPESGRATLVAYSGYGQDTDRKLSKDAGFDHHLAKPATIEQIESLLARGR